MDFDLFLSHLNTHYIPKSMLRYLKDDFAKDCGVYYTYRMTGVYPLAMHSFRNQRLQPRQS